MAGLRSVSCPSLGREIDFRSGSTVLNLPSVLLVHYIWPIQYSDESSGETKRHEQMIAAAWFAFPRVFLFLDLGLLGDDGPHSEHRSPLVQLK